MEYLVVPPARFRPSQKVGEIETQHSQNVVFAKILERNKDLRKITEEQRILNIRKEIQGHVNALYDSKKRTSNDDLGNIKVRQKSNTFN